MNRFLSILLLLILVVQGAAQPTPPPGVPLPPPLPPLPPGLSLSQTERSPIEFFRGLLDLSDHGLADALSDRNDFQKRVILKKVVEYRSLTIEERELRLQTTELRWYLKKLVVVSESVRTQMLISLSNEQRELLGVRLAAWDALSSETKREILAHERAMTWVRKMELATDEERVKLLSMQAPEERVAMAKVINDWRGLSQERRDQMAQLFVEFFELSENERARILVMLSDPDRRAVMPVIAKLQNVSAQERRLYVGRFNQLSTMSGDARAIFFKKARHWDELTKGQQQTWKDLVIQMPPLPPGLKTPSLKVNAGNGFFVPMPPLPPGLDLPTYPLPTGAPLAGVQ